MVVDGLIGDGFNGLIGSGFDGFDMGSQWCWVRLRLVMGLIYVCWVDPFDGFDLVLVSYGFDGLIDFDIFSYGFDWFNLRLVASILVLVSLF